jgi:hypothetical protein
MQRVHGHRLELAMYMWLSVAIAVCSATIPKAAVQSRDLLVFTTGRYDNRNGGGGGGVTTIEYITSLGVAVI